MEPHQHIVTTLLTSYLILLSASFTQGFFFFQHRALVINEYKITRVYRASALLDSKSKGDMNGDNDSTSSGKGFGKTNTISSKTKITKPLIDENDIKNTQEIVVSSASTSSKSAGKEALEKLRQADNQRRNEELKSMQQLQEIDQSLRDDPSLAVIPEKVAARMGKRMLPFVGLPLFGSMLTFVLFWYLARYKDFSIPTVLVAYATSAILILGLMGITYSVMSASWDEDREGTFIGWDEFQKNINNIKDGLQRSRDNAVLRDKLSTLSEDEKKKLEKF